jgi:branched-chain amino acid aminotransferase
LTSPAIIDGELIDASSVTVPVTDEGLLRGDGVFEVMRIYDGAVFALDEHLARMERSAANLRLPLDPRALRADCELLLADVDGDALLRLLVTRGGRRIGLIEPLPVYPPTLELATVEYAPSRVLEQVKSLSYAANMLADRIAKERGADLALLVTPHGRVLEGATSSFFYALDGDFLMTPPLSEHILDSITRRALLELVAVRERPLQRDELPLLTEAFLASTTREVHPVRSIDQIPLQAAPGPLSAAAATAFREHVVASLRR